MFMALRPNLLVTVYTNTLYVCRCADSHLSLYTCDMEVLVLVGLRTCRGDLGTGGGLVSFLTA